MMAKEIGYTDAAVVANNHELVALKENDLVIKENKNVVTTYLYQSYLMDLHNNAVGRNLTLNSEVNSKSYSQMFEYALTKNSIITDATKAYEYFNIQEYADGSNRIRVQWNLTDNTLKVWDSIKQEYTCTITLGS